MKDATLTADQAREAARWHRARVREEKWIQRLERDEGAEAAAMFRRSSGYSAAAAIALDAYADGIDAADAPEFRPTSSDTNRLHRIRARLLDLVPLDGTMSMADDVQRLDRALADAAAVEREACAAICDDADVVGNNDYQRTDDGRATLSAAARSIRARGQP